MGHNFYHFAAAKKIADAFEVSMDYLVGEGVNVSFDKRNLKRLQDIEKLDDATKDKLYFVIDNNVQNYKAKKKLTLRKIQKPSVQRALLLF